MNSRIVWVRVGKIVHRAQALESPGRQWRTRLFCHRDNSRRRPKALHQTLSLADRGYREYHHDQGDTEKAQSANSGIQDLVP